MFRFVLIAALVPLGITSNIPFKNSTDEGIVGGEAATIKEYPYQLALETQNPHTFLCGASLIGPTVALTAAHCTEGATLLQVRAGSAYKLKGGMVVKVLSIYDHPNYNLETLFDYDVSVLILETPLPNSTTIQTIALQPAGVEVLDGTLATVTGWGHLKHGGPGSNVLQKVIVPKANFRKCVINYRNIPITPLKVTERMECYGYPDGGKDSCQQDSGGPIVANGKQVGIVSFGEKCAKPGYPGVYAKISNKKISDHINKYIANVQQNM